MPIYEYRCTSCERVTEVMQRMGARAPKCEHCEGKLEKLISRTSFMLKGGGWFNEGYGEGGRKSPGGKEAKSPPSDSSKKSKPKKKTEKKS